MLKSLSLILPLLLVLSGCAGLPLNRRPPPQEPWHPLTPEQIADAVKQANGTLIKSVTVHPHSVIFMETPDDIHCDIYSTSGSTTGGLIQSVSKQAMPGPVTVIHGWESSDGVPIAVFCLILNDPQLQAQVDRVQVELEDGKTAEIETAGETALILPIASRRPVLEYQLRFFDQTGQLLHSEGQ